MNPPNRSTLRLGLLTLVFSALFPASSFGFVEFARGVLLLQTTASANYDSYFVGSHRLNPDGTISHDGDYYFIVAPSLSFSRNAGLSQLTASAGVAINRYQKNSSYDSDDLTTAFRLTIPVDEGSRFSGGVNFAYSEASTVNFDVNDRVRSKSFVAGANFAYKLGLKTSLTDTFAFSDAQRQIFSTQREYTNNAGFTYSDFLEGTSFTLAEVFDHNTSSGANILNARLDQTSNTINGTLSRPLYAKVTGAITYGYRFLHRSAAESDIHQRNQDGSVFSASLSGPFLPESRFPKLQSSMSIAYSESQNPGINDIGGRTVTGNVMVTWNARERTKISVHANRALQLSVADQTVEDTNVGTDIVETIGYGTTMGAGASYDWRKYRGMHREDETLQLSTNLSHSVSKYWTAGASYTYQHNTTNLPGHLYTFSPYSLVGNYNRSLVSIFVTNVF